MSQPFSPSDDRGETLIFYHSEDVNFSLPEETTISRWLLQLIEPTGMHLRQLNFIFCSDEYLLQLNIKYLNHDTYTDVITFPYAEPPALEGDIFISVERVRENAAMYQVNFQEELCRVMVHGVLHLCGYSDKTDEETKIMRLKEEEALILLRKISKTC